LEYKLIIQSNIDSDCMYKYLSILYTKRLDCFMHSKTK